MNDTKLYPPIINGTLPAFCGTELVIPFTMNKSVSENEVLRFELKLRSIPSNRDIFGGTIQYTGWNSITNEVTFTLPKELIPGCFYKVQMAYVNKSGVIGYYSTVGVIKCTSEPTLTILEPTKGNTYEGVYSQENGDLTEKVYSYEFILKDASGSIIESSGVQLHNSNDDFLYESKDKYTLKTDLEQDKIYNLCYSIKTVNGLTRSAETIHIFKVGSIDSKLKTKTKIECKLNYENGYIDVNLVKPDDVEIEEFAVGSFYLLRASDEDNFTSWHEVLKFVLQGQQPSRHLWKDMTIKQGVKYKYAIQQFNIHDLRSNKIESNIVEADFEYAFLYDGERQLKIKYNPKINSFKTTLLESKIDTIGSKHPFIFRNGNVNYKEFPISGLISYLSDENDLFYPTSQRFNENELYRFETIGQKFIKINNLITELVYLKNKDSYYYKTQTGYIKWVDYVKDTLKQDPANYNKIRSYLSEALGLIGSHKGTSKIYREKEVIDNIKIKNTNLTSENIYLERNFKLEVLEWLNNGKPKVFRSPTEGNYIVRLMNVSLSPNDQLGRMIHSFNCTAYEIAENTYENLELYNFINANATIEPTLRWLSVDLSANKIENNTNLLKFVASSIYLEDLLPGDKLEITTLEDKEEESYSIMIGATGRYVIDLNANVKISSISFKNSGSNNAIYHQGMLTYSYYSNEFKDSFDTINAIRSDMVPCQMFIGKHTFTDENEIISTKIETVKDKIDSIDFIRFTLRNDDIEVYRFNDDNEKYYSDKEMINLIDLADLTNIYKVNILDRDKNIVDIEWFDGYNNCALDPNDKFNTQIIINDSDEDNIDIKDTAYYELRAASDIKSIQTGAAIITEICYSKKIIEYDLESSTDESPIATKKNDYNNALKDLSDAIANVGTTRTRLKELQDKCRATYLDYNEILYNAIQDAERR